MNGFLHSDTLDQWRSNVLKKRDELSLPVKLGLALLMAALTGLAAQVRFPVPGTLVPGTGQVFAVLLSGVLLGGAWGGISQILYVGLGSAGVPWFAGMAGGVPLAPTAGYLMGFIVAASMIGWVNDHFPTVRHFVFQLVLMIGTVVVIYAFGAAVYAIFTGAGFSATMQQAVVPFIPFDLWKAFGAAIIASALLPKEGPTGVEDETRE